MLTSERLHRLERQSDAASQEQQKRRTPGIRDALAAMQSIFEKEEHLNELRIIREWLQDTLAPQHIVEVRKGYLAFTKNRVRAEKRASVGGGSTSSDGRKLTFGSAASSSFAPKNRGKAVKNLDPDAVSRAKVGSSSRTQRTKRRCCEHSLNTQEQDDWMLPSTYATRRIKAGEPQHCVARCYIMTRLLASKCKTSIAS